MTITCTSLEGMLDVIEGLITRQLGFKADLFTLTITLTGAH